MKGKPKNNGFSIIDVLIAMVILSFGLLALSSLQITNSSGNVQANRISVLTNLAHNEIEQMVNTPYDDCESYSRNTTMTNTLYSITCTVTENSTAEYKNINIIIEYGQNHNATFDYVKIKNYE